MPFFFKHSTTAEKVSSPLLWPARGGTSPHSVLQSSCSRLTTLPERYHKHRMQQKMLKLQWCTCLAWHWRSKPTSTIVSCASLWKKAFPLFLIISFVFWNCWTDGRNPLACISWIHHQWKAYSFHYFVPCQNIALDTFDFIHLFAQDR